MTDTGQAIEGYGCKCGYKTDDLNSFRGHLATAWKKDGKGIHASIGRINLLTGAPVMGPWSKRTKDEKKETLHAVHKEKTDKLEKKDTAPKLTDNISEATGLNFITRSFTTNLTPVLQTGYVAAQRVWGWREDMPFINFLDTVVYNYFREHGIRLAAYVVDQPAIIQKASDSVTPEDPQIGETIESIADEEIEPVEEAS